MNNTSKIAQNIKEFREAHGLTQAELGKIAEVSDKAVSTWENGKNAPRMGAIEKICEHYNIPKSQLLEGIGNIKKLTPEDEQKQELISKIREATPEQVKALFDIFASFQVHAEGSEHQNNQET